MKRVGQSEACTAECSLTTFPWNIKGKLSCWNSTLYNFTMTLFTNSSDGYRWVTTSFSSWLRKQTETNQKECMRFINWYSLIIVNHSYVCSLVLVQLYAISEKRYQPAVSQIQFEWSMRSFWHISRAEFKFKISNKLCYQNITYTLT